MKSFLKKLWCELAHWGSYVEDTRWGRFGWWEGRCTKCGRTWARFEP